MPKENRRGNLVKQQENENRPEAQLKRHASGLFIGLHIVIDLIGGQIDAGFELIDKAIRYIGIGFKQPSFDGAHDGIGEERDMEGRYLLPLEQYFQIVRDDGIQNLLKMI